MNRFKYLIITAVVLLLAVLPMLTAQAADNLIANPSVETISNNVPEKWQANRWGTNTATLTVANEGRTGTKSLSINMTAHTDGDAKWMADPVVVSPSTSYTYTGYYKATIDTEIDFQYTDKNGVVSYVYAQQVPASGTWAPVSVTFTTPANVAKVTVMHIVTQVGSLQTDDFALGATVVAPPTDEDNLIANPSFETVNGVTPAGWNKNTWGQNTAQFTYNPTGRTGGHSVTTALTQYTSGDAKWYGEPVKVLAGKTYLYRDYYKSSAPTRVVVAFVDASGTYTYVEQASAAASSDWKQYSTTFVVPATAVKATIFHLIDSVGSLTIDDTLLQVSVPVATGPTITNASFETGTTAPANWQNNAWGQNTATFAYVAEGRTGSKSAKVTLSNYVDGDAKWFFEPMTTFTPGKQYRFSAWYKTNVTPQAVMMYLTADGQAHFSGMPNAQPGANSALVWQQYSDTFMVPADAVAVSAFMFINQNGWLQTDDYAVSEYHPNGFTRPLLTLTFDDGHEDNLTTALPLLNQYGFKTTQCYATTFIEGNAAAVNNVKAFQNSGHEICSHTVTHPFLTSLSSTQLTYELQHAQQYLQSITGVKVDDFASPYGDYNSAVNAEIKRFYRSHRTVDEGYNSKDNFDIYRIRVQNILDTTTPDQVKHWIEQAQADKTWLVFVYHRVADDPGPYDTYKNVFVEQLKVIQQSGITVQTYRDALNEVTSQL
jgi:peptidoglycan/xylan/chitin deacetylase (PgdA/CDA1 family)